jgi:hypothetical protein
MTRILYLAISLGLAVFYYYFIGAGPGPSELPEDLEWFRPRGWLMRWDALLALAELADREGIQGMIPVFLFWIPPLALLVGGLVLFRAAVLRTFVVWLSLMLMTFAYYGVAGERVWRFFEWRFVAVAASFLAIVVSCAFAPSLVRSLGRVPRVVAGILLLALFGGVFMLQTEITGTDPDMRFNISPWPVITVFGMLFFGYALAAFHVSAGAGLWLAARRPGLLGLALGGILSALLAALGCTLIFSEPGVTRIAFFGAVGLAYMLLAHALGAEGAALRGSAGSRLAAGLLIVAVVLPANQAAIRNQINARDVTAQQVLLALEDYKKIHEEYPDRLTALVPDHLPEIPTPAIGLLADEDDEFDYSSFGDSYALEFASVQWVQCAYSPPYEFAAYDDEEDEDEADYEGEEDVDVAARVETEDEREANARLRDAGLEGSWNCPREPPKIW